MYNQTAVPSDAAASITRAGGRLVQSYDQIGVAVAVWELRGDNQRTPDVAYRIERAQRGAK